jgi:hypothetical protein
MRLQPKLTGYFFLLALLSLLGMSPCGSSHAPLLQAATVVVPAMMLDPLPDDERLAQGRRRAAHLQDMASFHGGRDTRNIALDDKVVAPPWSLDASPDGSPVLAIDGDPHTAWRGSSSASLWVWNLPMRRVVHLSLVRAYFGDAANRGVPSVYRWEYRPPVAGQCSEGSWQLAPHGAVDDRDPNFFVNGPNDVHIRRQALFTDVDACALRLVVVRSEGGPPVVREVQILEGAPSVARGPGVEVFAANHLPAIPQSSPEAVLDGQYETLWAGQPGLESWTLAIRLPEPRTIDRISLSMGLDAVTVARAKGPGRDFSGAYLPTHYVLESSPDEDEGHMSTVEEADPPALNEEPLPTRRRLIHLAHPRRIQILRITITDATGPAGERDATTRAPILRDIGMFEATDPRPVVTEPLFLSVDANPSGLTQRLRWGEAGADGEFARAVAHRMRRTLVGFDVDTGWPADGSRKRDNGRGRFLEAIEGDDPVLAKPLLQSMSPPPVLLLSGSLSFEFDDHTAPPSDTTMIWSWNVMASADEPDRGMGQLIPAYRERIAPFIGFCGGAHILGLFEAERVLAERARGGGDGTEAPPNARSVIDAVITRNTNQEIRPLKLGRPYYERAWWTDSERMDRIRPVVTFDPSDPLFAALPGDERRQSRELPLSHVDMLREPAFESLLSRFRVSAFSDYCSPLVDPAGPEEVRPDPAQPEARCVRVPQAFRSTEPRRFPVIGFQFHPEQRDLTRLVNGSPPDARGDAMNIFADAIDLVLDSYVRVYWPGA